MTIKPRLEAAGADVSRVFDVKMRKDKFDTGVSLPDDTSALREALIAKDIRIMIADPLAAMLDPRRKFRGLELVRDVRRPRPYTAQ